MKIRLATPDDVGQLSVVSSETYRSTYKGMYSQDLWLEPAKPDYFRPLWEADLAPQTRAGPVLVAEEDAEMIGFIAVKQQGDRGDAYEHLPADAFVEPRSYTSSGTISSPSRRWAPVCYTRRSRVLRTRR